MEILDLATRRPTLVHVGRHIARADRRLAVADRPELCDDPRGRAWGGALPDRGFPWQAARLSAGDQTPKYAAYLCLIASISFSCAAGSERISLISESGFRPVFSTTSG